MVRLFYLHFLGLPPSHWLGTWHCYKAVVSLITVCLIWWAFGDQGLMWCSNRCCVFMPKTDFFFFALVCFCNMQSDLKHWLWSLSFSSALMLLIHQTDCFNYIKILLRVNTTHLYVCGTYAFSPMCAHIVSTYLVFATRNRQCFISTCLIHVI